MNLTEEQFSEMLDELEKKFADDTQFLLDEGWIKTDESEVDGEKIFSVWICPTDKRKYVHQCSMIGSSKWKFAIDKAESNYIKKCGFVDFTVSTTCPELDEEFNKRHASKIGGENDIWDKQIYFIHSQSNRIYSWIEARDIARFGNMQDLPENCLCRKTNEIQKILDEQNIIPRKDMTLYLNFVIEDGEEHFYRFFKIGYSN